MEAIAAHAFFVEMLGNRIMIGETAMIAMKCGIKTCDLRQVRIIFEKRAYRCQIVGLMQRSERNVTLQFFNNFVVISIGRYIRARHERRGDRRR